MLIYKNISCTTKTFYGVTFRPGEVKSVPGYINDPNFIRVFSMPKEPPKRVESQKKSAPKSVEKPQKEKDSVQEKPLESKSNKEESSNGTNSDK